MQLSSRISESLPAYCHFLQNLQTKALRYRSLCEAINPKGAETGDYRVLRGGGAYHGKSMSSYSSGELCTSSARSRCLPGGEETTDDNGFRIVRTLEGKYKEIVRGFMR